MDVQVGPGYSGDRVFPELDLKKKSKPLYIGIFMVEVSKAQLLSMLTLFFFSIFFYYLSL